MPRARGMRQSVSRSAGRKPNAPDPIQQLVSRIPRLRKGSGEAKGEFRGRAGPRKAPEYEGTAEGVARVQLRKKRRR